jgi:outer membrane immunogenic protein
MRVLITALVALAMGTGTLSAADLRAPPTIKAPPALQAIYNWTGFYLGVNLGGGWSNANMDFSTAGFPSFGSFDNHMAGVIAGGQAGYNWQSGAAVFGVEADFQYSGMKGGISAPCPPGVCAGLAASFEQKMPWFGTARGRIGYASMGWLIYATGGYAYTRLEDRAFASAGGVAVDVHRDENRHGWTAGGGIEVAFVGNWSAKVEYLYMDFGKRDGSWTLTGLPTITDSTRLQSNIVRGGVNYRF